MGCLPWRESSDSGVNVKGAGVLVLPATAEPRERRKPDRDRHRLPSLQGSAQPLEAGSELNLEAGRLRRLGALVTTGGSEA
jgi:hypothetical protein